jgi:hypothetical protein
MSPHTFTRKSLAQAVSIGLLAIVVAGCGGSGGDRSSAAPSPLDSIVPSAPTEIPDFRPTSPDRDELPAPPSDPVEAVRQYVSAERAGDGERSFDLLAASSRTNAGSPADWIESAFQRPSIVDFELDPLAAGTASGHNAVTVTGTITLEPRLDEVSGFVPEHAGVDWRAVAEEGGWRVDVVDSTLHPMLPDEAGATAAAAAWATARQECRIEGEYAGSLLGSPALADQLCGVEGALVAGSPAPLGDTLSSEVVAAFGPDATTWARTVALSGAARLTVVAAPFGDHWVVVGVSG